MFWMRWILPRCGDLPLFVLGGGSNLVISDRGFRGLVLKIQIRGIKAEATGNQRIFDVGAGEDWDAFVAHTVDQNCAGLECLSGIPGAPSVHLVQNCRRLWQEVSQTVQCVAASILCVWQEATLHRFLLLTS